MWSLIISHNSCFYDPRVYHDLDVRSYLKGQGSNVHIAKFCVLAITFHL